MAKGISITITRVVDHVRTWRRDDPCFHSVWNGTKWVSLSTTFFSPEFAKMAGIKPHVHTTRLEFPAPGTLTIDATRYRQTLMKEMQKIGAIR